MKETGKHKTRRGCFAKTATPVLVDIESGQPFTGLIMQGQLRQVLMLGGLQGKQQGKNSHV